MTGPEHYREAERLLAEAATYESTTDQTTIDLLKMTAAQTHATLALAAATAELDSFGEGGAATGRDGNRSTAWSEVLR